MSVNPNAPLGSAAALPPPIMPTGTDPAQWAEYMRRWDAYAKAVGDAYTASSGFEREKLARQYEEAQKGRDQAAQLANLTAQTSRYGADLQRQSQIDQLKQSQRQFDATHALDVQRLGLDRAKTATDYLSTPDRYAQASRYLNLSSRVLAGQPGVGSYDPSVARPKTEADFAVLQAGGNPDRQVDPSQAAAGGGSGADARVRAIQGLLKASPPSTGAGLDNNDYAVLQATKHIMSLNLTPQQQAQINASPEYKAMLGSEARSQGQNPDEWWQSQQRSLPGQRSARLA